MAERKRVFISYSHDSDAHKQWVNGLASFLVANGIDVVLDQWDLRLGDDLPAFMERALSETDRVLVVARTAIFARSIAGLVALDMRRRSSPRKC